MLDCLTYIAFVYWAVSTVHTILPMDVAMCKSSGSGLSGGFLHHTFGGEVNLDLHEWEGYPCKTNLLVKFFFILRRPGPAVRHILYGGGQDEPFVPILFLVPLTFFTVTVLQHLLRVKIVSPTLLRTFLKFGVAIGCRGVILLQSIRDPQKQSLYYKRYSKLEFFIVAWTAYIIELPVGFEALVSGGTLATILLMCCLFPHHMLPEVDPRVVALQAIAGTVFGVMYASRQQHRRRHDQQRAAAQWAAASGRPTGKKACADTIAEDEAYYGGEKSAGGSRTETTAAAPYMPATVATASEAVQAPRDSPSFPSGRTGSGTITNNITDAVVTATTTTTTDAATAAGTPTVTIPTPATTIHGGLDYATPAAFPSTAATHHHDHILRLTPYVSRARPYRFSVKIQHAHLADLPPNLINVVNERVLSASGMQAVRVYACEGCVELVLDLRPIHPVRRYRTAPDAALLEAGMAAAAVGDDSRPELDQDPHSSGTTTDLPISDADEAAAMPLDATTLSQLGAAIVSYLHSSGVVQPNQEPSVVMQIGDEAVVVSWQPESQTWVVAAPPPLGTTGGAATASRNDRDNAGANSATPPMAVVPVLTSVTPSVMTWPGPDAPLRLTVALRGPSAEEILAGGGLVVRGRGGPLPCSIVQVTHEPMAAAEVEAPAAELLVVVVDVSAVPSSGLLQVEARSCTGLLSTARAVVVDPDEQLISGLKSLVSYMDDESADAVLLDYGTWLDIAATAGLSADRKAVWCGGSCCGGGRDRDTAAAATAAATATPTAAIASTTTNEANPSTDRPRMPYNSLDLIPELRDQLFEGACSVGCGGGGNLMSSTACPPLPRESMLAVAADLLVACCQAGGDDPALAAVADRLITMVIACDGRPYDIALTALLTAVRSPPTNASALHLAIASGYSHVAEVLLRWHARIVLEASASADAATAATDVSLWLDRAAGGVTPLHVAAAAADGGILATLALAHYPAVAAAWRSVQTDDGVTPAALAARQGSRWRLHLWYSNPVVLCIRRVVAVRRTAALGRGWELMWGFRDSLLEHRFLTTLNSQATLSLSLTMYVTLSALMPLACLTKAALYGGPETLLAALAFHGPSSALAWLCSGTRYHQHHPTKTTTTDPKNTTTATTTTTTNNNSAAFFQCCGPTCSEQTHSNAALHSLSNGSLGTDRYDRCGVGDCTNHQHHPGGGLTVSGLQWAVLVMQLCRAVTKAAVGLSVGRLTLPHCAAVFVARGGDIVLEALVRPFLEQMSLPARLLVSLADCPAMYVLYRGVELQYPGSVHCPLARALLYQMVLLAATAAISAANRARFLRWASGGNAKMGSNLCHLGGNTTATTPATAIATATNVTAIATINGTTTATGGMRPVGPHRRQRC